MTEIKGIKGSLWKVKDNWTTVVLKTEKLLQLATEGEFLELEENYHSGFVDKHIHGANNLIMYPSKSILNIAKTIAKKV